MALGNFSATVDDWVRKSDKRLLAVFKESAQRTFSISQSRVPVDTGYCRASFQTSLTAMPQIDPGKTKPASGNFPYDPGEVTLTIAGVELGGKIWAGYTANYAGFLEHGSSSQAPSGFVRLAALQWQATVSEVVADAKARVG